MVSYIWVFEGNERSIKNFMYIYTSKQKEVVYV